MLSNYLYNLCRLIISNCKSRNTSKYSSFMTFDLYENIMTRNNFNYIWNKKLHHKYTASNFNYTYTILEQNNNLLKIKLVIIKSFFIQIQEKEIKSSSTDEYLVIMDYTKNCLFNTLMIISHEEDEVNYNKYINKSLYSISNYDLKTTTNLNTLLWNRKINNIQKLYDNFINNLPYDRRFYYKFNIDNAIQYAEQYALTPNTKYINFNNSGGDCTNFISQILYAGGIKLTNTWKPYTNAWLRVEELYNYIIKNNIGMKLPDTSSFAQGTIIQFYTPQKGRFFHSAFITYVFPLNEALYCCHSDNKLNYPLSEIYPVIYPVIRQIALN
ncbi:MAG: hypothetical protein E7207_01325 [Clostridium butyricum]|nr:hypothetical protein [Clostridium butyricum]